MAEAVLPLWLVRTYEEGVRRALATAAVREEQERHQALKRTSPDTACCCGVFLLAHVRLPGCVHRGALKALHRV